MNTKRNDTKKFFNCKGFIFGLLIGAIATIGITNVFAAEEIKSAKYEEIKVSFNNSIIPLKNSFVSVVKNGENDAKMYMPLREILQYMGYDVEWNGSKKSINISNAAIDSTSSVENTKIEKTIDNNIEKTDSIYDSGVVNIQTHDTPDMDIVINKGISQIDKQALEMMYKTGN
jgi:hypothetical protein